MLDCESFPSSNVAFCKFSTVPETCRNRHKIGTVLARSGVRLRRRLQRSRAGTGPSLHRPQPARASRSDGSRTRGPTRPRQASGNRRTRPQASAGTTGIFQDSLSFPSASPSMFIQSPTYSPILYKIRQGVELCMVGDYHLVSGAGAGRWRMALSHQAFSGILLSHILTAERDATSPPIFHRGGARCSTTG